jgi:hypothetical protein
LTVTVGWTQADVDTLRAAIASGVLSVEFSGPPSRRVQYQSTDAMLKVLALAVAELATSAGTRSTYKLMAHRKGFE